MQPLFYSLPAPRFHVEFPGPQGQYPYDNISDFHNDDEGPSVRKRNFELKVKRAHELREITGHTFTISLYAGSNRAEETVKATLKGNHLEHKKKPKLECRGQ